MKHLNMENIETLKLRCMKKNIKTSTQVEHCPFNCDSDFKIFKSRKEMLDLIQKGYLELQVFYQSTTIAPLQGVY